MDGPGLIQAMANQFALHGPMHAGGQAPVGGQPFVPPSISHAEFPIPNQFISSSNAASIMQILPQVAQGIASSGLSGNQNVDPQSAALANARLEVVNHVLIQCLMQVAGMSAPPPPHQTSTKTVAPPNIMPGNTVAPPGIMRQQARREREMAQQTARELSQAATVTDDREEHKLHNVTDEDRLAMIQKLTDAIVRWFMSNYNITENDDDSVPKAAVWEEARQHLPSELGKRVFFNQLMKGLKNQGLRIRIKNSMVMRVKPKDYLSNDEQHVAEERKLSSENLESVGSRDSSSQLLQPQAQLSQQEQVVEFDSSIASQMENELKRCLGLVPNDSEKEKSINVNVDVDVQANIEEPLEKMSSSIQNIVANVPSNCADGSTKAHIPWHQITSTPAFLLETQHNVSNSQSTNNTLYGQTEITPILSNKTTNHSSLNKTRNDSYERNVNRPRSYPKPQRPPRMTRKYSDRSLRPNRSRSMSHPPTNDSCPSTDSSREEHSSASFSSSDPQNMGESLQSNSDTDVAKISRDYGTHNIALFLSSLQSPNTPGTSKTLDRSNKFFSYQDLENNDCAAKANLPALQMGHRERIGSLTGSQKGRMGSIAEEDIDTNEKHDPHNKPNADAKELETPKVCIDEQSTSSNISTVSKQISPKLEKDELCTTPNGGILPKQLVKIESYHQQITLLMEHLRCIKTDITKSSWVLQGVKLLTYSPCIQTDTEFKYNKVTKVSKLACLDETQLTGSLKCILDDSQKEVYVQIFKPPIQPSNTKWTPIAVICLLEIRGIKKSPEKATHASANKDKCIKDDDSANKEKWIKDDKRCLENVNKNYGEDRNDGDTTEMAKEGENESNQIIDPTKKVDNVTMTQSNSLMATKMMSPHIPVIHPNEDLSTDHKNISTMSIDNTVNFSEIVSNDPPGNGNQTEITKNKYEEINLSKGPIENSKNLKPSISETVDIQSSSDEHRMKLRDKQSAKVKLVDDNVRDSQENTNDQNVPKNFEQNPNELHISAISMASALQSSEENPAIYEENVKIRFLTKVKDILRKSNEDLSKVIDTKPSAASIQNLGGQSAAELHDQDDHNRASLSIKEFNGIRNNHENLQIMLEKSNLPDESSFELPSFLNSSVGKSDEEYANDIVDNEADDKTTQVDNIKCRVKRVIKPLEEDLELSVGNSAEKLSNTSINCVKKAILKSSFMLGNIILNLGTDSEQYLEEVVHNITEEVIVPDMTKIIEAEQKTKSIASELPSDKETIASLLKEMVEGTEAFQDMKRSLEENSSIASTNFKSLTSSQASDINNNSYLWNMAVNGDELGHASQASSVSDVYQGMCDDKPEGHADMIRIGSSQEEEDDVFAK